MRVLEGANVPRVERLAAHRIQVHVAFRTRLIAYCGNVDSAAMLTVACAARKRFFCLGVMSRAIVAGQAGRGGDLGGELAGLPQVARRALFFEDRLRL